MLGLELVVEGLGIMVVDENERGSRRQLVDELKDLRVALSGNEWRTSISFTVEASVTWDIAAPLIANPIRKPGLRSLSGLIHRCGSERCCTKRMSDVKYTLSMYLYNF